MPIDGSPLAYLITFTTYGTWLHGDFPGSVDRDHNVYQTPWLPPKYTLSRYRQDSLTQPPYKLDGPRREHVLNAIREVCAFRQWNLLAAHVRTNHAHIVVQAECEPEFVMTGFKSYASRALNLAGFDNSKRKRWTRHGSTRYLWSTVHVNGAVRYTVEGQGAPMAVYCHKKFKNAGE